MENSIMNREDILRMALEAGAGEPESLYGRTDYVVMTKHELERLAALVAAAEHKWFVQVLNRVVMSDVTHEMLIDVIKRRGEKYAPDSMETSIASSGSDSKKD